MTDPMPSTSLPRVLVPITIHFAVRYVVRTGLLAQLRAHCEPVLALSWDDDDLAADLASEGVEVVRLPDAPPSAEVARWVAELDVSFARRLRSPSTAIDRRRRHVDRSASIRARRWATAQRAKLRERRPGAEARAQAALDAALARGTGIADQQAFLDEQQIDAVLSVTPFTVQELVLLHAVERSRIPAITSILSFDNVTTRPPLPIRFDRYLVWNRFNADELQRGYPGLHRDRIAVVGPAQFDFYADADLVRPAAAWRGDLGLPDGARTVLYGAGPPSVSPHEAQYLDHLLAAIDDGALPHDLHVVLRRHPNDLPARWERFARHPRVHVDDPGAIGSEQRPGQTNLGRDQIIGLCSTLAHTDVHVNVSSTLTLDGAFYGKPQIGPAYDVEGARRHRRRAIELYEREHFLPIVASGGLELSRSRDQLVAQVADALADPDRLAAERTAMLEAMCTHTDGRCTDRVAREVQGFLASLPTRPGQRPSTSS
jgi:hypothetical protein